MFHIRFHRHQLFFKQTQRKKDHTTFATSGGESGQISHNYPTETSVHIQHVPLENIVLILSLMVFPLTPLCCSSNNQVAQRNKPDISCSFEVITIIFTPPRKVSLLQAFMYTSSSCGHHPPSSQYFGADMVYWLYLLSKFTVPK